MPGPTQPAHRRRRLPPIDTVGAGATEYLAIGETASPHGVRGFFSVRILTDFPRRFKNLRRVYLGEDHRPLDVERVRILPDRVLMKVAGVDSPESASSLRNQLLYVPVSEAVPLAEGEYYWYQIIGLEVWTTAGEHLGKVTDIFTTGSNDVYIVQREKGELLVPAIEDVISAVDLEQGRLTINLLPDLL